MDVAYRKLNLSDLASLQGLLESNPGYSRRVSGREPHSDDSHAILTALPPGIDDKDAKHSWGLWEHGRLVAFVDVIRGYPSPNVAYIGLLLTAGDQSRRGLGRAAYGFILGEIREWKGVTAVRLGIVASNAEAAEPFWQSLGFTRAGEVKPYVDGTVTSTVTFWECSLSTLNPV